MYICTQITTKKIEIMKADFKTLTKLNNKNYKWFTIMGDLLIFNLLTDEWVISISDKRIYFRNELDFYNTSDLYETTDDAKIAATSILNTHF